MECVNNLPPSYVADIVAIGLVLIVMALAGLVYSALRARRSALGDCLLEACGGDFDTAALAIDNVRQETQLLAATIVRDFNKGRR